MIPSSEDFSSGKIRPHSCHDTVGVETDRGCDGQIRLARSGRDRVDCVGLCDSVEAIDDRVVGMFVEHCGM